MSICNVWLVEDRAVVAVDAMTGFEGGAGLETSKLCVIPHLHLVVTGRGLNGVKHLLADRLRLELVQTFDQAVTAACRYLPSIAAEFAAREPTKPKPEFSIEGPQEVVLVGWSPRMSRMVAVLFSSNGTEKGFASREIKHGISSATCEPIPDGRTFNSLERLVELTRAQVAFGPEQTDIRMFGGRLLVAEVTKTSVTCCSVCEL
jgi:hypothetical protein